MRWVKLLLLTGATAALFSLLYFSHTVGGMAIPALGPFLDPFSGFWQNGEQTDRIPQGVALSGLHARATVLWDEHRIPHVFASDLHDLFLLQGFLTARDRLWQMEFQTHAAAGRLAEIAGERLLEHDRHQRRIGMVYAAENSLEAILADPVSREAVEAYTAGVNAWIDSLNDRALPLEYKILGYRPERWTPVKCALLLKQMTSTLSGYSFEKSMSLTREALGAEAMERLFPELSPFTRPIVPEGTVYPFPAPELERPAGDFPLPARPSGAAPEEESPRGSNNWAVAGSRTRSGAPILCSDPHLPLSLPSVWYEMQLTAPGLDAYGVTFPGAPGVIIGFNRDVAWGPTNAESDALDWYLIRFRDRSRNEYLHDGGWKKVEWRKEIYRVRGGETVEESVPYTHHGPVPYTAGETPFSPSIPADAAMRWIGHERTNELRAFLDIDRAGGLEEFSGALSRFESPAQNFAYADREGNIALWHAGRLPLRWPLQGKYLSDGSDPAYDWKGWVPREHLPALVNPERGFVHSSNQNPAGGGYPYYIGHRYSTGSRAVRIEELLAAGEAFTPEVMLEMQNDVVSVHARQWLPILLGEIDRAALTDKERELIEGLERWDLRYRAGRSEPLLFDTWQYRLQEMLWAEELPGGSFRRPRRDITLALILDGGIAPYVDIRATEEQEEFGDLVLLSFRGAVDQLESLHGSFGPAWEWGAARGTNIRHLTRIPAFGRNRLRTDGQHGLIRVTTRGHGQSWRMVVEMGAEVRGWGNYPGGQSGNPGSPHFDDFIDPWVEGEARELLFPRSAADRDGRFIGATEFVP